MRLLFRVTKPQSKISSLGLSTAGFRLLWPLLLVGGALCRQWSGVRRARPSRARRARASACRQRSPDAARARRARLGRARLAPFHCRQRAPPTSSNGQSSRNLAVERPRDEILDRGLVTQKASQAENNYSFFRRGTVKRTNKRTKKGGDSFGCVRQISRLQAQMHFSSD